MMLTTMRLSRHQVLIKSVFSSRFGSSSSVQPTIYVSGSTDPYFNLAFEDWIFRKTDPDQIILYLYRNTPSVIIGRNQNPWKEINLDRLNELKIPFVRRKSGGGTVYHDLGNTNYCVYVPRLQFERRKNAEMVARALNELSIEAVVNERNDICVEGFKICSAFKLVNSRAYHHGTMLIDAKLGDLRGLLGNKKDKLIAKGVASFPSPVKNLREWSILIDHEEFVEAVAEEFTKTCGGDGKIQRIDETEIETNDYVRSTMNELQSWDWKYGQTPEFTNELSETFDGIEVSLKIKSRHALITEVEVAEGKNDTWRSTLDDLSLHLIGDRYSSLEKVEKWVDSTYSDVYKDRQIRIMEWLRRAM